MGFLASNCTLENLDQNLIDFCVPFDCGNSDLNDFFAVDSILFAKALLGKTCCFTTSIDGSKFIVAAFTVSNNSVKTRMLSKSKRNKINSRQNH